MLAVAAVVVIVLGATFAFVYRSTGTQLQAQIDRSVRTSAIEMRDEIFERGGSSLAAALSSAQHFARSQPYRDSTVLLFALIPGVGTASNHPELFGLTREDSDDSGSEQTLENAQARRLLQPHPGYSTSFGPDIGQLRLFEIPVKVAGRTAYAGAGEALASVSHAQEVVRHSFELAGLIGIALALLAAYLTATRITAPIRSSAAVAASIDAGELSPRIRLPAGTSHELELLADALNRMLDRLAIAFAAQREFVADASHELRTPLTVLRGQLDVLSGGDQADGSLSAAELERVRRLMQSETARLTRLVDDLLVLAQSDRSDFLHPTQVALDELVTELWDGLSLIAERNFEIGRLEPVSIRADPDRLAQALRNLARNAITHTQAPGGLVRVDVTARGPDTVRITVSDDGPGIPAELRLRVFERFFRTDKARSREAGGAGLGLAIVQAITEAHRGTVQVIEPTAGGASFALELPIR